MAEAKRFELLLALTLLPVFKTGPFNRLGTPPKEVKLVDPAGLEPTTSRL
jgi:hypothetical protein